MENSTKLGHRKGGLRFAVVQIPEGGHVVSLCAGLARLKNASFHSWLLEMTRNDTEKEMQNKMILFVK